MKVRGLVFDPNQNTYIVILREEESNSALPIWIGWPAAHAISLAVEGIVAPRPLIHDLIGNIIERLRGRIISIVLTDLKDSTYYAKIHLAYNNSELAVDARPSDAIALALRANAPIFVQENLVKKEDSTEISKWLEGLIKPEET
jgi:bifunctional DNase/RNase